MIRFIKLISMYFSLFFLLSSQIYIREFIVFFLQLLLKLLNIPFHGLTHRFVLEIFFIDEIVVFFYVNLLAFEALFHSHNQLFELNYFFMILFYSIEQLSQVLLLVFLYDFLKCERLASETQQFVQVPIYFETIKLSFTRR